MLQASSVLAPCTVPLCGCVATLCVAVSGWELLSPWSQEPQHLLGQLLWAAATQMPHPSALAQHQGCVGPCHLTPTCASQVLCKKRPSSQAGLPFPNPLLSPTWAPQGLCAACPAHLLCSNKPDLFQRKSINTGQAREPGGDSGPWSGPWYKARMQDSPSAVSPARPARRPV